MADKIENSALPSLVEQQVQMTEEFASLKHMMAQMSLVNEKLTNLEHFVVEIYQSLAVGRTLPPMPSYLRGLASTISSRDQNPHATADCSEYSPDFPKYGCVTGNAKNSMVHHPTLLSESQYVSSSDAIQTLYAGVCIAENKVQMTSVETSCKSWTPENSVQPRRSTSFTPSAYHKKARIKQKASCAPLAESYTSIFKRLSKAGLLQSIKGNMHPTGSVKHWLHCAYHSGAPGHDTENCWTLKNAIQKMIDDGQIHVQTQEDLAEGPMSIDESSNR